MTDPLSRFNPEILQARWVLGGLNAEELSDQATVALQLGFAGNALQQLAGLCRPARRDLDDLPERAFGEMGLEPIDEQQAVDLLIARGEPSTSTTIRSLRDAFPDFSNRWKKHVANWGGNPAGSYTDMAVFVYFVVEDLYEEGNLKAVTRVFELLDVFLVNGDQEDRDLIGIGFFESLRNISSWRPYGSGVFEKFMPPMSMQIWKEIERQWAGKSSLMDVIRAERRGH